MAFSFLIVDEEPYFLIAFLSATCLFFKESWTEYPYFFKLPFFNGDKYTLGFFSFALKLLLLTHDALTLTFSFLVKDFFEILPLGHIFFE